MKQKFILASALALMIGLLALPSEAVFVQCPGGSCDGPQTDGPDVILGTPGIDNPIDGNAGDDFLFGGDSPDLMEGDDGNDIVIGGAGSDFIDGGEDNDILLVGPDTIDFSQVAFGFTGNDIFNIFVGEISSCLLIVGAADNDVVNLIGFGPYTAIAPFGIDTLELGVILVVDPITGGRIMIVVDPNDPTVHTEVINGLATPNVAFLPVADILAIVHPDTGTDPCPVAAFTVGIFGF